MNMVCLDFSHYQIHPNAYEDKGVEDEITNPSVDDVTRSFAACEGGVVLLGKRRYMGTRVEQEDKKRAPCVSEACGVPGDPVPSSTTVILGKRSCSSGTRSGQVQKKGKPLKAPVRAVVEPEAEKTKTPDLSRVQDPGPPGSGDLPPSLLSCPKALYLTLNDPFSAETRVKAAWRYGGSPVRALTALRRERYEGDDLCTTCSVKETERHVLHECPVFAEWRRDTTLAISGCIGGRDGDEELIDWLLGDPSEWRSKLSRSERTALDLVTKRSLCSLDRVIRRGRANSKHRDPIDDINSWVDKCLGDLELSGYHDDIIFEDI